MTTPSNDLQAWMSEAAQFLETKFEEFENKLNGSGTGAPPPPPPNQQTQQQQQTGQQTGQQQTGQQQTGQQQTGQQQTSSSTDNTPRWFKGRKS